MANYSVIADKNTAEKLKTDSNFLKEYLVKLGVDPTIESKITVIESPAENGEPAAAAAISSSGQGPSLQNKGISEWTPDAVILLIETRLQMEPHFQNKKQRKCKLWDRISKVLEASGFFISSGYCDHKWRNLLITYRKNLVKMEKSGRAAIRWEYFDKLFNTYGSNGMQKPSEDNDSESEQETFEHDFQTLETPSPSVEQDSSDSEPESPLLPVHAELTTPKVGTSRKRKRTEMEDDDGGPPEWYLMEMRRRDKEAKRRAEAEALRWQEKKQREERKLDLMSGLIDVLKKLAEK